MRFGLPISFVGHALILGWGLIAFDHSKPNEPAQPLPVEVAMITEDGLTRLTKGSRRSKLLEAAPKPPAPDSKAKKKVKSPKPPPPATPPPELAPEPKTAEPSLPEPAKPEPAKPEPAKPEPAKPAKPDPIAEKLAMLPAKPKGPTPEALAAKKKAEQAAKQKAEAAKKKAEQAAKKKAAAEKKRKAELLRKKRLAAKKKAEARKKKRAEAKRRAAQRRKRERAKKRDDFFAEMRALRDNDPTKRAAPPGGARNSRGMTRGPVAGARDGKDQRLTASQLGLVGAMFRRAVSQCWNINSGAAGIDKIRIEVEVKLSRQGRLMGRPRVVSRGTGPLYADVANSAMRALVQCEPYDLPKNLYKGGWDFMIVEFDPSQMY